jgi:hypothetical protein
MTHQAAGCNSLLGWLTATTMLLLCSHCWKNPFGLLVEAVNAHLGASAVPEETWLWIDLFGVWAPSSHAMSDTLGWVPWFLLLLAESMSFGSGYEARLGKPVIVTHTCRDTPCSVSSVLHVLQL